MASSPLRGATPPSALLFALSVGVIITNIFAPQTLVGPISVSLALGPFATSLAATATLLGYALGLFLLVPLADLLENRALAASMLSLASLSAIVAALASSPVLLLAALLLLGATSSAIQVLVPIAASMVPPERRGQMIGDVMSGLMVGILLSRPLASFIADKWSWRGFYAVSAAALILVTIFLAIKLPRRYPERGPRYPALIASLGRLLRTERTLRRRSLTAALTMGSFSVFWTSIGPRLTEPPFFLDQQGIAIFAVAGAGGAVATPIFGRLGDRGLTRPALLAADLILLFSVCVAAWAGSASPGSSLLSLCVLAMAAFAVDFGVVGDQTLGRRAINLLAPEARGRINAIFVGVFFVGGAIGSALAGPVQALGGWPATCALTAAFGVAALLVNAMDRSSQAGSVEVALEERKQLG